ncbi:uncharacterized protein LOC109541842 [Dendroctonus ponderosae]|uniref:Uncharacterized protein n=1 Tax=Dendroctonus ponderosae TaxID=77166 RepID=A0AAR5PZL2_DENPD|nr:uncharacterized protein LOC109541842 [Dendroctonus ponderosae]
MSSRPILSRPRTKIYDSNYNIGESYYKSTLDRLDRKYSGRPLSPQRYTPNSALEIADRHARAFAEEDLEDSRRRASSRIKENHLFDSRGARYFDDAINDETASTLKQIRAAKKVSYVEDADLESASNNLRTQRMLDRSEKILDSIGINESSASKRALANEFSYQKRSLKMSYDADADNLTKWKAVPPAENGDSTTSAASIRARRSRARIDDIDDEMAAMQEKQAVRERRVARLKQLVAECDSETVDDNGVATTEKKVHF